MTTPQDTAKVLAKCAAYDPLFAKPNPEMAVAWAEGFTRYDLALTDLLEAVSVHYTGPKAAEHANPGALITAARDIRKTRTEREKTTGQIDRQAATDRRRAIDQCTLCDPNGWIEIAGQLHRCTHNPNQLENP